MNYKFMKIEQHQGIEVLTIMRPEVMNALHQDGWKELRSVLEEVLLRSKGIGGLVITGEGNEGFIAGLDPTELNSFGSIEGAAASQIGQEVCSLIERIPVPVIAAVNGTAIGGGCEVALSCDLIVASSKASFQQIEVLAGLIPGFGGTYRLPRRIGINRAKFLIFSGQAISADVALEWGLVHAVVNDDQLLPYVLQVFENIGKGMPEAVSRAKMVINATIQMDLTGANIIEREVFSSLFSNAGMHERMAYIAGLHLTSTGSDYLDQNKTL